ncbi:uncharacterized protein UTRI_05907_B [Ustilago trichophora]|uniref:Uncharacterized protein n=1 Tax=Ustilago trichophora TaxID=86804 RepID=A0A5C3ELH0_9BASI|nr:uncharacterized protein UTRI_05907_B [Ustilago trichophora]
MTIMDGDDMQRLWSLIEDLTNQLQANRQLCESLQQQADQLRGQAIHSGTGFALRRFNTDLSKEKFESELEALNAHLVKENLSLSHENKQQAVLLREYENTLETVMAKFRSFSHSTQQHTLQLTQHYESLLAQTTHNAAEQTLAAETAFSGTLTHLGGLVRRAMQSMDGEVSDDEDDEDEHGRPPRKTTRGWIQDPKWYGSGGYTGKTTDPVALRADEALEQLTEEERLRLENDTLRELLGLKEKSDSLLSNTAGAEGASQPGANATPANKPMSPAERRASLTVDEAAIAAEASGQPPYKALQVSCTTRPGEENTDNAIASPSRASPKLMPTLERKDQIIEEAILAEDESETDRGRRAGDSSPSIGFDKDTSIPSPTSSLPVVFAADDADIAPSSIEELRAAAKQTDEAGQVHTTLPPQPETNAAVSTDADEIAPIDEVDLPKSAGSATSMEPNLLAEAAPPALVSTGIEEGDAVSSKTTVTSASGIDVAETTTAPSSSLSSPAESSVSSEDSSSSKATSVSSASAGDTETVASREESAPPAESAEGDFQPVVTSADDASKLEETELVIPAEPAKEDNEGVSPKAAAETQLPTDAPKDTAADKDKSETNASAVEKNEEVKAVKDPPATPNQGKKDGSASPNKKGRGNRGKGNRHHKSNSSASNKNSS